MLQDVRGKLSPGMLWPQQHSTIIKVLFTSKLDLNIRKKLIKIFTSIHNNYCLTQLYFARGDMLRLLVQPSSGQLTIEQDLLCAHNMGSHTVYI